MSESEDKIRLPIVDAITSKGNWILIILGVFFLVDYLNGSPGMLWVVNMMAKLWGFDPQSGQKFKIITPFGTFTDRNKLARIYDYVGMGATFGVAVLSILYNAVVSITWKKID